MKSQSLPDVGFGQPPEFGGMPIGERPALFFHFALPSNSQHVRLNSNLGRGGGIEPSQLRAIPAHALEVKPRLSERALLFSCSSGESRVRRG